MDEQHLLAIKGGNALFEKECHFMLGVAHLDQLVAPDRTEIAFAGRSNVGKSSLINALTRRKDMAKASATPGRTQQLNFFNLDDQLYLVDLPGYGFASAPDKQVKNWNRLLFQYLQGRPNLRRVYVLIDSRHGIKEKDIEIMDMLDKTAVSYQIILTKADKVKPDALEKMVSSTKQKMEKHAACHPALLVTSSEKSIGIEDVRASVWELVHS